MAASDTKPKVYKDGEYNDPVYKKLARINGEINKLTKKDLQEKLTELGIDDRGVKEVLRKRLKNYYKKRKLMKAKIRQIKKTNFDYFAVIDFEATCEENNIDFHHEIIEFPIVLVDIKKMEISYFLWSYPYPLTQEGTDQPAACVQTDPDLQLSGGYLATVDKFHEYVRPVLNPKLTKFCSKLTGIKQSVVDAASNFPEVLNHVEDWLKKHSLGDKYSFSVLTDGPWDMYRFMYNQCEISHVPMPRWSKQWVNIRKTYSNFYQCRRGGIEVMLQNLGMKFEGSPHSGIDDATNIARIALKLMTDGCDLSVNEYIQIKHVQHSSKVQVRYEAIHDDDSDNEEREIKKKDKDSEEPDVIDSHEVKDRCEINTLGSGDTKVLGKTDTQALTESMNKLSISPNSTCEEHDETLQELIRYYKSQKAERELT